MFCHKIKLFSYFRWHLCACYLCSGFILACFFLSPSVCDHSNERLFKKSVPFKYENIAALLKYPPKTNNKTLQNMFEKMKHRDDLYLNILQQKNHYFPDKNLSKAFIISSPDLKIRMPPFLRKKQIWTPEYNGAPWTNVLHFPWLNTNDSGCQFEFVSFSCPKCFQITGLVSYPGSGNTWLRYLIETLTGYFTGSMYNDIILTQKGYYGEAIPPLTGMTIVTKSHGFTTNYTDEWTKPGNHQFELGYRAIVLIRNPLEAIVSHRHLDSAGHTGRAQKSQFQGLGWRSFVRSKLNSWEQFYESWISDSNRSHLLVIHLEDLKHKLEDQLHKIVEFLQLNHTNKMECVLKYYDLFKDTQRKKNVDFHLNDPYTLDDKNKFSEAIQRINKLLIDHGYQGLPIEYYKNTKYFKN